MPSINSSYTNLSNSSLLANVSNVAKISKTGFDNELNSINETKSSFTTPTSYGFKADENGFMDPNLNEVLGLPQDIKIHISTMQSMEEYANKTDSGLSVFDAMSKAWNTFKGLVSGVIDSSQEQFVGAQTLAKLPQ